MIPRQNWVDHKFSLSIDCGWTQNILTRLRDTAIRLTHHCNGLNNEQLSIQLDDSWSIKEHIGHLIDLEGLHFNRLNQFLLYPEVLKAADLSNSKTYAADYNRQNLDSIIKEFVLKRNTFIKQYEQLNSEVANHKAMHPRLKMLMRPVDLLFFMAEHDDHHLTSILQIKKQL